MDVQGNVIGLVIFESDWLFPQLNESQDLTCVRNKEQQKRFFTPHCAGNAALVTEIY